MAIKAKTWADYDIGDLNRATAEDLKKAVRKAAKAANQRLVRLERAGFTRGVYRTTMSQLGDRKRFKETTGKLSLPQLRREYSILRGFLSAKSSTVSGQKDTNTKRYETAVARGYSGTQEDFYDDIERYFAGEAEKFFSSDIIYQTMIQGTTDLIDTIINQQRASPADRGDYLKEYLKKYREQRSRYNE